MKSLLLLSVSLLISLQTLSQEQPALLSITGEARVAVKPTLTVVSLAIRSSNETYAGTIEELTNRIDLLVGVLKKHDFPENVIYTSNFSVNKNFVYVQGERKERGFNGVQTLKVQFEQNKNRLLEVLTAVTGSKADPEITVSFDLDPESKERLEKELISQAVKDAKTKAQLIAQQADYQIAGIRDIKYGISTSVPYNNSSQLRFDVASEGAQVNNFEVSDLTFTDSVLIVFEIEPK